MQNDNDAISRNRQEIKECDSLLTDWIRTPDPHASVASRIDILDRLLEVLRVEHACPANQLPLEEFLQARLLVNDGILHFAPASAPRNMGCGTAPIHLQPKLLMFLLINHRAGLPVYDIINNFIGQVRPSLTVLDFKKTRTGVTRCFTNTRFAAHTLRDYGFLKFTRREAYKTWVLSLPGFVVASAVYESRNWAVPVLSKEMNFELHHDIRNAWAELSNYELFVQRLARICQPNIPLFKSFAKFLYRAYDHLAKYWNTIRNPSLTQHERRRLSFAIIKTLESDPDTDKFCAEFSTCIQIEDVISKNGPGNKPPPEDANPTERF